MNNPIKSLTRREWCLWLASLAVVLIANQITPELDPLTMTAALVGVTSLVFAAKGNVWSQVLMIVFSILYGVISFRFHYWGEMITYLGMTLPMAVWSTVTWLKNPSKENGSEVAIQTLARRHLAALAASTVAVAAVFYYILKLLDTPNLFFSTVSIITSFLAAALTMLRSSYYAVGYAAAVGHGIDGKSGLHPRGGQLRHLPAQRPLRLHKLEKARGLADGLTFLPHKKTPSFLESAFFFL